jgi:hypothetical protein
MLRCERCWCISDSGRGWFALVVEDPAEDDAVTNATYCPACAERYLDAQPREPGYV